MWGFLVLDLDLDLDICLCLWWLDGLSLSLFAVVATSLSVDINNDDAGLLCCVVSVSVTWCFYSTNKNFCLEVMFSLNPFEIYFFTNIIIYCYLNFYGKSIV